MTEGSKRWHVANWHPLAWVETGVKLAAHVVAVSALVGALQRGGWAWPGGGRLAQFIVLIVLSLGLVAAIFDRLQEREIVAMAFVLINNVAHWGMVRALASPPGPGGWLTAFAALMLVGDLLKLVFLAVSDFTVRDTPRSVLYGLTLVYVVGYIVILALQWLA
jgi:hypothetical protein